MSNSFFTSKEELLLEARKQVFRYLSVANVIANELGESKHNCPDYKKKEK